MRTTPNAEPISNSQRAEASGRLRWILRSVLIAIAFIHMLFTKRMTDPDGTSYLDIAKAYLRHDWQAALNSYWSPLYSWLLAIVLGVFRPGLRWQVFAPHLISFVSFLCLIVVWEWLIREYEKFAGPPENPGLTMIAGYAAIAWVGLKLNGIEFTSADIIATVLLLVCAALMMRMRRGAGGQLDSVWMGIALGLGFLAKAAFLTAILVLIVDLAFVLGKLRRSSVPLEPAQDLPASNRNAYFLRTMRTLRLGLRDPRLYVATITTFLVIFPFVLCLSLQNKKLTISKSGSLNYSWHVSGMSVEGYKEEAYTPGPSARHRFKVLFADPRVLSVGDHLVGSYPVHYDPAWWSDGYPLRFDRARQLFILSNNIQVCLLILIECPAFWLAALCGCVRYRDILGRLAGLWFLWIPAIAICAAYCVVYVLPRYVAGPFALLSFVFIASAWKTPLKDVEQKMVKLVLIALSLTVLWDQVYLLPSRYFQLAVRRQMPWGFHSIQVAEKLSGEGLEAGDRVGYIGDPLAATWAGLADAQIVAFIPTRITNDDSKLGRPQLSSFERSDRFWLSDCETQRKVFEAFRSVGAKWAIADEVPNWADTSQWKEAGLAGNMREGALPFTYFRRLDQAVSSNGPAKSGCKPELTGAAP